MKLTFLNDAKVNGELYAFLLSKSIGEDKQTIVYKKFLPSMQEIASEVLQCKSRSTAYSSFNYLIEKEYLVDQGEYYIIRRESPYFSISQDLLEYLVDTLKQPVIKTYVYLGIRNSYKPNQYVFTIKEICEHLGLNYSYSKNRDKISNYLTCLAEQGLITVVNFRDGKVPKMRLIGFSTQKPQNSEIQKSVQNLYT